MTVVRELLTVLGFDLDSKGLDAAEKGFVGLIDLSTKVVAGAAAIGAALVGLAFSAANVGDEAYAASLRVGLTVEQYQRLTFAAKQSNVSAGELEGGLRQVARSADTATRKGGETARAYALLGVKVTDSNGKLRSSGDILIDAAEGLKNVENGSQRAAIAQTLFGRSGQRLLPLLLEGKQGIEALMERADQLGFVLSEKDAKAGDELNDAMEELQLGIAGVSRRLGVQLIPAVLRAVKALTDLLIANRALIDRGIMFVAEAFDFCTRVVERFIRVIIDNQRFFAFLGLTLGIIAGVISLQFIPAVLLAAKALIILIAQMIIAAAPVLALVAFIVLLALAMEDLYVLLTGGKSLIGELFTAFLDEPAKPDDTWMVRAVRWILYWIREGIRAVDLFFSSFFDDATKMGGVWGALKNAGGVAIDYWKKKLLDFTKEWKGSGLQKFLDVVQHPIDAVINTATNQVTAGVINTAADVYGQLTRPPGSDPRIPISSGGGPPVVLTDQREVKIDITGVTDPAEQLRIVHEGVAAAFAEDRRELARQLDPRGKR